VGAVPVKEERRKKREEKEEAKSFSVPAESFFQSPLVHG
jgi:hypothetical protein